MSLLCFPAVCRAGSLPASVGLLAVLFCRVEPLCDFWGQANLAFLVPLNLWEWESLCLGESLCWALSPGREQNRPGTQTGEAEFSTMLLSMTSSA